MLCVYLEFFVNEDDIETINKQSNIRVQMLQ